MGFSVGRAIPIGYYHGQSGQTINARIEDESGGVFGAELTLVENAAFAAIGITGYYESTFTPDSVGRWTALIYSSTVKYGQMFYEVGASPELRFTATASSTTTLTAAALVDVVDNYLYQMAVPLSGDMVGQGRFITAYNGTNQITVSPA